MIGGTGNKWRYFAAVVEFTTSPLAGAVAGHYADLYFKTDPVLTIIMLLLGMLAGTIYLIRILGEPYKDS